jgi:hypothetical protein
VSIDRILEERKRTHGDFDDHANISQGLKDVMRQGRAWPEMGFNMREALEMIVHKIARIVNGKPRHKDHWDDIEGYSRLVSKELQDVPEVLAETGAKGRNVLPVGVQGTGRPRMPDAL